MPVGSSPYRLKQDTTELSSELRIIAFCAKCDPTLLERIAKEFDGRHAMWHQRGTTAYELHQYCIRANITIDNDVIHNILRRMKQNER